MLIRRNMSLIKRLNNQIVNQVEVLRINPGIQVPTDAKLETNNAAVFRSTQHALLPSSAKPAMSHRIWQAFAQQNVKSDRAENCPISPFSTATDMASILLGRLPIYRKLVVLAWPTVSCALATYANFAPQFFSSTSTQSTPFKKKST